MEQFLTAYINGMRPQLTGFPAVTAHEIASAFLAFRFRLFPNAIQECTRAISLISDGGVNGALKKALSIVRANAEDLENAVVTADLMRAFSDEERPYLPVDLPPIVSKIRVPYSWITRLSSSIRSQLLRLLMMRRL